MTRADLLLRCDIQNILVNGVKDENPRPRYADGTQAHTYFVTHNLRQYHMDKGEFPVCTLRPIAWKTAIKEILAIYQNQSNKISEFERYGCKWWKDWALEDGTIGKSYPYNLESHRPNEMKKKVVKVLRRIVPEKYKNLNIIPSFDMLPSVDNKIYFNKYIVIGKDEEKSKEIHNNRTRSYSKIQFINNGYITTIRTDEVGKYNGNLLNPYERTVFGVGYLGDYKAVPNFEEWEIKILKRKWVAMMKRCYSKKYKENSPTYENIFVHNEWHSFENFLKDVRYLPQYFLAKEEKFENWHLDKDYYGSNAYSKNTCVFLKLKENVTYARNNGCYKITDKNGNVFYDLTIAGFAETIQENDYRKIHKDLQKSNKYQGFIIEKVEETDEYVYRYELSRNQVVTLINDIKNNPYGRRHIISFWNWANIDKKALVECAYETIWTVRGEYLDMCLIQRSGDMLTASGAGGINEIQYAALLMMVAKTTGYKPGKFTHVVINEQIYDKHIEQAKELVLRCEGFKSKGGQYDYEFENVKMEFNPKSDDFYDFTIDDFNLVGYEPQKPQLTFELGI